MDLAHQRAYWRSIEATHAPLRRGDTSTPRHLLVADARLRLRVLDPYVPVWSFTARSTELGLVVIERKRCRVTGFGLDGRVPPWSGSPARAHDGGLA